MHAVRRHIVFNITSWLDVKIFQQLAELVLNKKDPWRENQDSLVYKMAVTLL
jgi:hypothetical protein